MIQSRWKLPILFRLYADPSIRTLQLKRDLPGISQKMLTAHLRELARDGLIERALARAQAAGELADDVEPAVSGRLLLSVLERMRVVGQTAPDHIMSQAMFETFIDRFVK
eukprot:gene6275-6134_t